MSISGGSPDNYEDAAERMRLIEEEERKLTAEGYRKHETDWEIHRGGRLRERIVDARVSVDGRYVWTKLGPSDPQT